MKRTIKKRTKQHYIYVIGVSLIMLFSLWKSKYGFGGEDESFYLTIPYRMCHGDKLILDEWHVSQFSAFLLYPIMKIYLFFSNSTESIVLHFRYIYIFLNLLVGTVAYVRLRRYRWGAVFVVWIYLIFVPYNIMALSYNSMGVMLAFLCTVMLFSAGKNSTVAYIFAGIFYAGIVLCQPLLSIIFIITAFFTLVCALISKRKIYIYKLIYFTVGCCILAFPIFFYLGLNLKIDDFLNSISFMLGDPEHSASRDIRAIILKIFRQYFPEIILDFKIICINSRRIIEIIVLLFALLWGVIILDKKRIEKKWIWLSISACLAVSWSFIYLQFIQKSYINFILFPWVLHGITTFFILSKTCKKKLALSYIIGIEHALAFLGSNQYGYVFCLAFLPAALFCILYNVCIVQNELKNKDKRIVCQTIILSLSTILTVCFLIYARVMHVFWQTPIDTLNTQTNIGATKGIFVSNDTKELLYAFTNDILHKKISKEDNLLILSKHTWLYLNIDAALAQYSAWLSGVNQTSFDRLEKYYEINPDKYPNKIYIDKSCLEGNAVSEWAELNNYNVQETEVSYYLSQK